MEGRKNVVKKYDMKRNNIFRISYRGVKKIREIFSEPNHIYYYENDIIKHRRNKIIEAYNELDNEQQRRYIEIYTLYI